MHAHRLLLLFAKAALWVLGMINNESISVILGAPFHFIQVSTGLTSLEKEVIILTTGESEQAARASTHYLATVPLYCPAGTICRTE